MEERKRISVGNTNFMKMMEQNQYYVDKTLLIKELLDRRAEVILFTRPRRFGKTMNMEMLRSFFEIGTEAGPYFENLKIGRCEGDYIRNCGTRPIIYLSLKEVKGESFDAMLVQFSDTICQEVERLQYKGAFTGALPSQLKTIDAILNKVADASYYMNSLKLLSRIVEKTYGVRPIILIDEYDAPIQSAFDQGYYEEAVSFLKLWLTGGLKDNISLEFAVLTGVTRIAKESIFSDLNNLVVNTVLDYNYSEFFGFTEDEVQRMVNYFGVEQKTGEIQEWYDGYRFGNTDVYNPWSVVNYFANNCHPGLYWVNTSENSLLTSMLLKSSPETETSLRKLMEGIPCRAIIHDSMVYESAKGETPDLNQAQEDPIALFTQLVMTGYLKIDSIDSMTAPDYECTVKIPNEEVKRLYKSEILKKCNPIVPRMFLDDFSRALTEYRPDDLANLLQMYLKQTASSFDTAYESFFHGLVLGMCAMLYDRYYTDSNRESGYGRYDIQLMSRENNPKKIGVLIELKAEPSDSSDPLELLAEKAVAQIREREYFVSLQEHGCTEIYLYGVAFRGKQAAVKAVVWTVPEQRAEESVFNGVR